MVCEIWGILGDTYYIGYVHILHVMQFSSLCLVNERNICIEVICKLCLYTMYVYHERNNHLAQVQI